MKNAEPKLVTVTPAVNCPPGAKLIPLSQGKFAIVDECDYPELSMYKWCFNGGYAARGALVDGRRQLVKMHRQILNTPKGMETDHINGNGLDNRRCNIRICTGVQNMRNRGAQLNNKFGLKGVTFNREKQKYRAQIRWHRMNRHLGYFDTSEAAHAAYCEAAKRMHKEFAKTQ